MNRDLRSPQSPAVKPLNWPLAVKISLSIGSLLLVLASAVALLTFYQVRQWAYSELEHKALALADMLNYSFEVLLDQDAVDHIQRIAQNGATIASVESIVIVTSEGTVLASSDPRAVGQIADGTLLQQFLSQPPGQHLIQLNEQNELVVIYPLRGGRLGSSVRNDNIGAVQITLLTAGAEATARTAALELLAISLGSYLLLSVLLVLILNRLVVSPLHAMVAIAQRFRTGERSVRLQLHRGDEIGLLASTFDSMAQTVESMLATLEAKVAERTAALEQQRADLACALDDLQASTAERLLLAETVRELSTPVIPLHQHILLMPLIGSIDTRRAQQIEASLLEGIQQQQAHKIILDLTGIPIVDTEVAACLLRTNCAVQLLGASVIMVGISPQVAQTIVHLGVDLSSIETQADLQSGILAAFRSLGVTIQTRARRVAPDVALTAAPTNGIQ